MHKTFSAINSNTLIKQVIKPKSDVTKISCRTEQIKKLSPPISQKIGSKGLKVFRSVLTPPRAGSTN